MGGEKKVEHFAKGHAMNSHLQALLEMFKVIKTYNNWATALLKQKKDASIQQCSKWSLGPQADWLAGNDSNSQSCLQDRVKLWISGCVIYTTLKALLLWVYYYVNVLIVAKLIISHSKMSCAGMRFLREIYGVENHLLCLAFPMRTRSWIWATPCMFRPASLGGAEGRRWSVHNSPVISQ